MKLTNKEIRRGLKYSIAEGSFAHIYANLTGSIFLPAFAIILMASDFTIGLLASIPLFCNAAQIIGSLLVQKYGHRKKIALGFALSSRSVWIPVVLLIVLLFNDYRNLLLTAFILLIIVHHALGSIAGVAWLSWMSNLVPPVIRGRFFGLRNSVLGMITLLTTLVGGLFLDWYKYTFPEFSPALSFIIIFFLAVIAGMISLALLAKQPDIEEPATETIQISAMFSEPLRNDPFKKMFRFGMFWSFAVNFASPFFIVFMLRDLHMSYTLVSAVTICSAVADLFGMGFWGYFSDKHGNRPVAIISAAAGSLLPFIWLFTSTSEFSVFILIPLLHLAGGFFFAGYNLCSVNLIFSMAPRQNNSMYFALWSMVNGVAAGLGAISGGVFAGQIHAIFNVLPFGWESVFKFVFLFSSLMRFSSLFMLRKVPESRGVSVSRAIRILRSVRTWATTLGYHPLLQFFLPGKTDDIDSQNEQELWPLWETERRLLPSEPSEK
jgi:MFS family permease